MLSRIAATVVPALGRLTTSTDLTGPVAPGILVANHTSLADPGIVLAALRSLGIEPVVLATAGLWRVPVLGQLLERGGHVPVHRRTARLGPPGAAAPEPFRSGPARLALASGAPVVPVGQAGARRVVSGGRAKQVAGLLTAPVRRPRLHVHVGAPLHLPAGTATATATAHRAVEAAWRVAVGHLGDQNC
ncbi:lysophospholipid acyltransferase family protein [Streptomyces apricus]|uniref:1-acyl-sn-glycerol-3-phosphate acyltransferase n=1 Tax=Streptomyces apricus TaxID=1828112 RepID=A0A5A9ZKV3_9ACTN|nr:lysophospholipid acyltransferase family protein [Streptomyces apricus]KAA0917818.1 1-acyl-sn-glycerol-3-phosphate acyltransferase [Streptomyces apricus]